MLIDGDWMVWDLLGIVLYLVEWYDGVWLVNEVVWVWVICVIVEMYGGFGVFRNEWMMNIGVWVDLVLGFDVFVCDVVWIVEVWGEGFDWFGGLWLVGVDFGVVDVFYVLVVYWVWMYGIDVGVVGVVWVECIFVYLVVCEWEEVVLCEIWCEVVYEVDLVVCGCIVVDYCVMMVC